MINATLCFLLRKNPHAQILLGRKKRGFGEGKYNGIGGKIDPGERPLDCIVREVREEVDVILDASAIHEVASIVFRFPYHTEFDHNVHVYVSTRWSGEPAETAEMAPRWFDVSAIPYEQMWQDDAHWLPRILAGERIRAEFTFAEDNETLLRWEIEPR